MTVGRHTGVPLETRGLVADYDAGTGAPDVWGATKVPHFNRDVLAGLLGLPGATDRRARAATPAAASASAASSTPRTSWCRGSARALRPAR